MRRAILAKRALDSQRVHIREWALVQKPGVHNITVGQMIDNRIHELDLLGTEGLVERKAPNIGVIPRKPQKRRLVDE